MSDNPMIGVVGLSGMGESFVDIATDLECEVAGTDADRATRNHIGESMDIPTYEDCESMYDDIDAVIIATPNKYHEDPATVAFEEGLDVYIEKPLAHDFESAKRIVEASRNAEGIFMTSYHYPSFPLSKYLKSRFDQGFFGEITHIEARHVFRRHVPHPGSWYTSKAVAGGGALQDKGSFVLDMLFYFGLGEIESVVSKARTTFGDREDYTSHRDDWGRHGEENIFDVEDSISTFIKFEDGTTASIEVAWAANSEHDHSYRIRGTDGGAFLDIPNLDLTFYDVLRDSPGALFDSDIDFLSESDLPTTRDGEAPGENSFLNSTEIPETIEDHEVIDFPRQSLSTFIECVKTRESPDHGDLERALRVQKAIKQIYDATDI